jgi:flavin reductase (DIM6/NTAB) family NADH-FMN oxidoreductase RutF
MRKNFGSKTWMFPMPVLIVAAYDENGNPNAMNAAWGGIFTDNHIGICISEGHKTTKNIRATKAFTVSMATAQYVAECDFVGIVSGNKMPDKLQRAGFSISKSQFVNAPIIDQLPMTLECELISYDEESNFMVGHIVNISADENILNADGNIDAEKLQPITYDSVSHHYRALGKVVGNAFADGKKLK